jgi:hypothetical protein
MAIPKKAAERITAGLKKYQAILTEAKNRDISESDTVVIIADMLADIFGYKKYVEITTEFAIRGTFVDLAIKVDQDVRFLIEAKAIGVELKEAHVKQAVDYGANEGIEWIILTNANTWRVYKIHFGQPIDKSLVFELDILGVSHRNPEIVECLGNLSREGYTKSAMTTFLQQQQAMSKFSIAAALQSEALVTCLRRELKRAFPSAKIDEDILCNVIQNEVLKREMIDSDEARLAGETFKKASRSAARAKARAKEASEAEKEDPTPVVAVVKAAPTQVPAP